MLLTARLLNSSKLVLQLPLQLGLHDLLAEERAARDPLGAARLLMQHGEAQRAADVLLVGLYVCLRRERLRGIVL